MGNSLSYVTETLYGSSPTPSPTPTMPHRWIYEPPDELEGEMPPDSQLKPRPFRVIAYNEESGLVIWEGTLIAKDRDAAKLKAGPAVYSFDNTFGEKDGDHMIAREV